MRTSALGTGMGVARSWLGEAVLLATGRAHVVDSVSAHQALAGAGAHESNGSCGALRVTSGGRGPPKPRLPAPVPSGACTASVLRPNLRAASSWTDGTSRRWRSCARTLKRRRASSSKKQQAAAAAAACRRHRRRPQPHEGRPHALNKVIHAKTAGDAPVARDVPQAASWPGCAEPGNMRAACSLC